jgi:Flp pilus assembly protein TadD
MSALDPISSRRPQRASGLLAAVAAGLMAGACSSTGGVEGLSGLLNSEPKVADTSPGASTAPKTELDKALAYWSEEHKKKPHDLKTALAFAKNLKAAGHKDQAFGVLQGAALIHGDDKDLANELGRLALENDQVAIAEKLLALADDPLKPDWRVISARGTVFAKQNKFAEAIPFYERALAMAPTQASVMNNLAMAHAANGDPVKAEEILRKAAASSNDPKVKQNLALVLGLQGRHDEAGTIRSTAAPQATAAADTDFVKRLVKATPATNPAQATPAIATAPKPARPGPQQPRLMEAKAPAKAAPANDALRPASGPGAVASPTGAWSTSVSVSR